MTEIRATFAFVDMAGYTAASWVHGDDVAAVLAIRLKQLAQQSAGEGDQIVKSIGDAVMCRSHTFAGAVGLVGQMFADADAEPNFPHLCAGIHTGTAVEDHGDYFGSAVNIAARLASLAEPDEILASATGVDDGVPDGWRTQPIGPRLLRNISDPIEVARLVRPDGRLWVIDPVCKMRVDPATAVTRTHAGAPILFCSDDCATAFTP